MDARGIRYRTPIAKSWQLSLMVPPSCLFSPQTSPPLLARHHATSRSLRFSEFDDDLDIVSVSLEGAGEVLRPLFSGDQPVQPGTVCPGELFAGSIPVPLVGV